MPGFAQSSTDPAGRAEGWRGHKSEQGGARGVEFLPQCERGYGGVHAAGVDREQRGQAWLHDRRKIVDALFGLVTAPSPGIAHHRWEVANLGAHGFGSEAGEHADYADCIVQRRPFHAHRTG